MKNIIQTINLESNQLKHEILKLKIAAESTGCFLVSNSPVEKNYKNLLKCQIQLDQFYNSNRKNQLPNIQLDGATRGYYGVGSETGNKSIFENKESFSFGYNEIPQDFLNSSKLVGQNIYPKEFEQMIFNELIQNLNQTCLQIVQLIQICYPHVNLVDTIDETSLYQSFARSFRYYEGKNSQIGNSLHTDWNLLTLVWADRPGLEVLDDNIYHQIHPSNEFNLICNFGDFISSITNGKVKSPWHRVILPEEGNRNSIVYFYYPRHNHEIVNNKIYNNNRLLGLFVDQSKQDQQIWNIPNTIKTMGEMYAAKWKQVSNY